MSEVLHSNGLPGSVCSLVCGGANIGRKLATDGRVGIVSFTGSTKVGRIRLVRYIRQTCALYCRWDKRSVLLSMEGLGGVYWN